MRAVLILYVFLMYFFDVFFSKLKIILHYVDAAPFLRYINGKVATEAALRVRSGTKITR